jgi:hypothetical protein
MLVDVTPAAKDAGFRVPVALTAAVRARLEPSERDAKLSQSVNGRLWDVLMGLRSSARNVDSDTVIFEVIISENDKQHTLHLKAVIGRGDHAEPVATIMFEHQVCFAHLPIIEVLDLRLHGCDETL